jgi:hypothetical protein
MDLSKLQAEIVAEMVPASLVNAHDAAAIARNTEFLLGIEDRLVAGFYDTLGDHPQTAAVFHEGERPAREQTLRGWWQRTVTGPLDDRYWAWMGLVGVVHIRRGVRNPMMLSMMAFIADAVQDEARAAELASDEVDALRVAFTHLTATASAVISESYTQSYIGALQALGGLNPRLLATMLSIEIQAIEDAGRVELGELAR